MLQYLVILLDDTSTSFCHYEVTPGQRRLINLENLRKGIRLAMMQGLKIQFVYPDYEIPEEWKREIETVGHCKIMPASLADNNANVVVADNWDFEYAIKLQKPTTIRVRKDRLFEDYMRILPLMKAVPNLNVVILDIDTFDDKDYETYKSVLSSLSVELKNMYIVGILL